MNPIDELAQIIRTVDGNHDLGAGALAERLIEAGVTLRGQTEAWALDALDPDGNAEGTWWFTSQAAAIASIPAIICYGRGAVESVTPDADNPEEYVAAIRLPDPPAEMVERFRAQGHPHDGRGGLLRYRFRVSVAPFPELHTAALSASEES